ncbi:MAG TPA: N-methyl-L-tryptophan oxidase [Thermomicrobiales bacterium]|nr:N-methyl-L-tryptophan oxidase [Thermomicrobiales bacterium]
MSERRADVIVVGGGTMGTAAGWALARRGHSVIVLEQFQHIHNLGSHSGHTRIFRHAYFEGPLYVPWTVEADAAWVALQERTGIDLMVRCGCLDLAAPGSPHAQQAAQSARAYDLPHEILSGDEVSSRFPAWTLPPNWEACFDPEAGILLIEPTLRALLMEFRAAGGVLHENQRVLAWESTSTGVTVTTASGAYEADRLIVTAGAWTGKLLADLNLPLEVCRKPVMWFNTTDSDKFSSQSFPAFIAENGVEHYYGLPAYGDDSLKIGIHSGRNLTDPDTINRNVEPEDLTADMRSFIDSCLDGAKPELTATSMCMYTMTPDEDFILDRHPMQDRVALAAGFSGHGYKFAPVIGEHLADLATKPASLPRGEFAISRFG